MVNNTPRAGFAARFQQALEEAGLGENQLVELGELFGVTAQAVRKWLNAESMPGSGRAPEIAEKLGVRRAWLLDGEEPMRAVQVDIAEQSKAYAAGKQAPFTISPTEFRLLLAYRSLPGSLQKSVSGILDNLQRELTANRRHKK